MLNRYVTLVLLLNFFTAVTIDGLWSSKALADEAPFQTELGFKRLSDPSTPNTLRQAAGSVYEVRMLSEEKEEDLLTLDLTDPIYANIEQKIQNAPELDNQEKIVIKKQIEYCRKNRNETNCTLFLSSEKATGFIAGEDGSSFWTNAHVTNRFLKFRASLKKIRVEDLLKIDARVAMFLFDQNGNLVYNPFDDIATIEIYDQPSTLAALRGDWYAEDTDFVMIKLGRSIGVPLKIGARPTVGQTLFRPGFAACTGCPEKPNQTDPLNNNDRGAGKNSDGQGLYWTSGTLQPTSILLEYLEISSATLGIFNLEQMLFFSADAQVGFSGGPILNEYGEVVGVFAGSKPKMYGQTMVELSRGVRPTIFEQLK